MNSRTSYSDEVKAACMAALLEGQSINQVADQYKIPRSTVGNWRTQVMQTGVPEVSDTKRAEMGDLLVGVLRENLKTLQFIAETTRNPEWVLRQDSSALATFYGVMTDKAVRLIEAFGVSEEGE